MKISIHDSKDKLQAKIEHKEQELWFDIGKFGRKRIPIGNRIFETLNRYWEYIPEEKQDAIFVVYRDALNAFLTLSDEHGDRLNNFLSLKIAELLSYHNLDDIYNWLYIKRNVFIPSNLSETYVANIDINTTREKTYIRKDYIQLLVLTLALKSVAPIWGQYFAYITPVVGSFHVEMKAFDLLSKSEVYKCEAMKKLTDYVASISEDKSNDMYVYKHGISTEDFVYWLVSVVITSNLCIAEIATGAVNKSLVATIFSILRNKLDSKPQNTGEKIQVKKTDESGDEEDKSSSLDRYKIKHSISMGELTELEHSVSDPIALAKFLRPNIDVNLVQRSLSNYQELMKHMLTIPQVTILGWVLSPIVSSRGLRSANISIVSQLLKALEAILWDMNYKRLALLVSSYTADEASKVFKYQDSRKGVIEPELLQELDKLYPYQSRDYSIRDSIVTINPALEAINLVVSDLTKYTWITTAHESMTNEILGVGNKRMGVYPEIRSDLARLLIQTVKR